MAMMVEMATADEEQGAVVVEERGGGGGGSAAVVEERQRRRCLLAHNEALLSNMVLHRLYMVLNSGGPSLKIELGRT
jgi:hypothetical protein